MIKNQNSIQKTKNIVQTQTGKEPSKDSFKIITKQRTVLKYKKRTKELLISKGYTELRERCYGLGFTRTFLSGSDG